MCGEALPAPILAVPPSGAKHARSAGWPFRRMHDVGGVSEWGQDRIRTRWASASRPFPGEGYPVDGCNHGLVPASLLPEAPDALGLPLGLMLAGSRHARQDSFRIHRTGGDHALIDPGAGIDFPTREMDNCAISFGVALFFWEMAELPLQASPSWLGFPGRGKRSRAHPWALVPASSSSNRKTRERFPVQLPPEENKKPPGWEVFCLGGGGS